MAEPPADHLLTYAELGERLGLASEGARAKAKRKARAGEWTIIPGNDGWARVRLPAEALPDHPPRRSGMQPGGQPTRREGDGQAGARLELAELMAELARLRTVVAELRDGQAWVERFRTEAIEARVDAVRAIAEREATKAATAAELAAMRQQLGTEVAARNTVIEELKAGLEHERARSERLEDTCKGRIDCVPARRSRTVPVI